MCAGVAKWMLATEARALLTRLERVKPFALHETMVPAASLSLAAQAAIENYLARGRRKVRSAVHAFLRWLAAPEGCRASPADAQRRFTLLRLRFNSMLTQFDIFADVMTQRSEHETGVWLAGLDVLAADALALPAFYKSPPIACYLERGHGAAIRRARTRLPGGGENPVAVVRVPRERMIGSGIGSSLLHEVGHEGSSQLDLVHSLRPVLHGMQRSGGEQRIAWQLYERWLSEILADFWSVARLGLSSTMGLMGVVSLPRPFVFRFDVQDPHPIPWVRVKISAAIGEELFPHAQWKAVVDLWESFYPLEGLNEQLRRLIALLEATLPGFVSLLVNHRPPKLRGKSLKEALDVDTRQPARLAAYFRVWSESPAAMRAAPPSLVFAALGQARAEGRMSPETESRTIAGLLTDWALRRSLSAPMACGEMFAASSSKKVEFKELRRSTMSH